MASSSADPFAYPCPACPAGRREACFVEGSGRELSKPHAKRVKHAEAEAAKARRRADGDAAERITGPRWRRLYAACRLELEQRGDWTVLAAEQLEGLVHDLQAAADAREERGGKLTTEGSMGQKVAHPNVATELRLEAQALATARSLKLTPDTRGTSAPRPGDEDVPREDDDGPGEERDELADLDDIARKRRERAAKAGKSKAKRRRGGA